MYVYDPQEVKFEVVPVEVKLILGIDISPTVVLFIKNSADPEAPLSVHQSKNNVADSGIALEIFKSIDISETPV